MALQPLLEISDLHVKIGGAQILSNINLTIHENEQWAILGASGSGKTTLAHTLAGKHFFTGKISFQLDGTAQNRADIVVVDQQHRFKNKSNTSDFYYQQRFNSSDSFETISVAEDLLHYGNENEIAGVTEKLRITQVLNEPLIQLSNGENKRLQLAKALLQHPKWLILDNPFIGLDIEGRSLLQNIINDLSDSGTRVLLLTSSGELPDCITHVAILDGGTIKSTLEKKLFSTMPPLVDKNNLPKIDTAQMRHFHKNEKAGFLFAIRMKDVNVEYEGHRILQDINWQVKKGEHWALSGPNGAGKSTLLSLVTGDNPKAYANEIYLFDRRRGTGESIWDIKKKIGYVSPEMHLYFDYGITCFEAVASGLFDTIGLFRPLHEDQVSEVEQWIDLMSLRAFRNKSLSLLSSGQQRLVLLARAMVKDPELLILDEPCQGMDALQKSQFLQLVSDICRNFDKTLVYVSHYQDEIPDCIKRVMLIRNGIATEMEL